MICLSNQSDNSLNNKKQRRFSYYEKQNIIYRNTFTYRRTSFCRMRTFSELPVIMLTAVTDEETQVQTFDNLADDYICKPFSLILLLKRIEALLRARYKTENTWKYKDAVVDFSGYRATYLGKDAAVTPKEIKLLAVLLENAGQVVSRDQILDRIWGEEESPFDRVVDVYVKNLRKKLQLDCIITVKGVGYKLELP